MCKSRQYAYRVQVYTQLAVQCDPVAPQTHCLMYTCPHVNTDCCLEACIASWGGAAYTEAVSKLLHKAEEGGVLAGDTEG